MRRILNLFLIAIVTAVALWWGGTNAYVGWREREPFEVSCADFLAHRPDAHWLRLTHCTPDLEHMAEEKTAKSKYGDAEDGKRTAVYVVLRPEGETTGPARIVVRRTDEDILFVLDHDESAPDFDDISSRVDESLTEPTEGLIQFGLDMSTEEQHELGKLDLGLAPDFSIVERDARPTLWFALAALGVGLIGLLWLGLRVRRLVRS